MNLFFIEQKTKLLCFKTRNSFFQNNLLRVGDLYYHHKYKKIYIITIHGFIDSFEYFSFNTIMHKKEDIYDFSLFFKTRKLNTYLIDNPSCIRFIDTPNINVFSQIDKNYTYIDNIFISSKESIRNKILENKEIKKYMDNSDYTEDYLYQYITNDITKTEEKYIEEYLENIKTLMDNIECINLKTDTIISINNLNEEEEIEMSKKDLYVSPKITFKSYHQKSPNTIPTPYLEIQGYNQIIYLNKKNKEIINNFILYLNEYGESSIYLLDKKNTHKIKLYRNDFNQKGLINLNMYDDIIYPSFNDIKYIYYNKIM